MLIENTAGAGGTMGVTFEDIAAIIDAVDGDPRIGVCLDTAHLHAAGYDLRTPAALDSTLAGFDAIVGLDRLVMFHLNDSKAALGSNRDRHENIGFGDLGADAFATLLNHPALADLPGITRGAGHGRSRAGRRQHGDTPQAVALTAAHDSLSAAEPPEAHAVGPPGARSIIQTAGHTLTRHRGR